MDARDRICRLISGGLRGSLTSSFRAAARLARPEDRARVLYPRGKHESRGKSALVVEALAGSLGTRQRGEPPGEWEMGNASNKEGGGGARRTVKQRRASEHLQKVSARTRQTEDGAGRS